MFPQKKLYLAVAGCLACSTAVAAEPSVRLSPEEVETANVMLVSPVVVTATRIEQNSFDLPVSIDVVDAETIHDGQAQVNLSETSIRIPGVVVSNRSNYAQDLGISTRGFGARSAFGVRGVRLYADGIPMSMPDGQGQTGTFNLDTAKSVEFLRGPFSALYGNSSGGVVQLMTADGPLQPTLAAGINFGSYNTNRENINFGGQIGDLNYNLNAAHFETDGYRYHSEAKRDTFNVKIKYQIDQDSTLTFVATALDQQNTMDPQGINKSTFLSNPKAVSANTLLYNTRGDKSHAQVGVVFERNITENDTLHLMGYYGKRKSLGFLSTLKSSQTGDANELSSGGVSEIDRDFGGIDARLTHKTRLLDKPLSFTAGINYDTMTDARKGYENFIGTTLGIQGQLRRDEDDSVFNFDKYLQAQWDLHDRWTIIAGIRNSKVHFKSEDHYANVNLITGPNVNPDDSGSATYEATTPVIGAIFKLTPSINLYANAGKGFETPTFIELAYKNSGSGLNFDLQPSKSKNYEVGAKAFVGASTRVNIALFKIDTKHEIVTDSSSGGRATYKNAGGTERKGLEFTLDSALGNNFNAYAAIALLNAEYSDRFTSTAGTINAGNKIPGTYASTYYGEISWKHPGTGFSTALEGSHFSKTYTNDKNDEATSPYTVFNWRGGFVQKVSSWKFSEFVRLNNITDKQYAGSVRVNDANRLYYEAGASRNWLLGVNASYQF